MRHKLNDLIRKHIAADDDIFTRISVYPIALPVSWFLLNFTRISANAVTLTGLVFGVTGCLAAAATQQLGWLGVGFFLFFVCDFVDGQVASARGGSQLGALLDLGTDRLVLLFAALCLAWHHVLAGQNVELFMLIAYLGLHNYVDLLLFAKHRATQQHRASTGLNLPAALPRRRGSRFSPWCLLPSRLSSPLAFFAAYAISGSFYTAYFTALVWVASEYGMCSVKLIFRLRGASAQPIASANLAMGRAA